MFVSSVGIFDHVVVVVVVVVIMYYYLSIFRRK